MSVDIASFRSEDPKTHWISYEFEKIDTVSNSEEALRAVKNDTLFSARVERLKAVGLFVSLPFVSVVLVAAIVAVMAIFTTMLTLSFNLMPLWAPALILSSEVVAVSFLAFSTRSIGTMVWKKVILNIFEEAKAHWNYASHLYNQSAQASEHLKKV